MATEIEELVLTDLKIVAIHQKMHDTPEVFTTAKDLP